MGICKTSDPLCTWVFFTRKIQILGLNSGELNFISGLRHQKRRNELEGEFSDYFQNALSTQSVTVKFNFIIFSIKVNNKNTVIMKQWRPKLLWSAVNSLKSRKISLISSVRLESSLTLIWEKMQPPNIDMFCYENTVVPVLLFVLIRLFIMPKISNWKISVGITCW